MKFSILEPQWNGGNPKVGLNEANIEASNEVEILYENKSGQRTFPKTYKISGMKILTYPTQEVKGIRLRIIPISELEAKK